MTPTILRETRIYIEALCAGSYGGRAPLRAFRTGDLGAVANGVLTLCGRLDLQVQVKGATTNPAHSVSGSEAVSARHASMRNACGTQHKAGTRA